MIHAVSRRLIRLLVAAPLLALAIALLPRVVLAGEADRSLNLPGQPYNYVDLDLPPHFTTRLARIFDTEPADNRTTNAGATLGRALFYDTRLSATDTVSCSSCHVQRHAFSDPRRFSVGYHGHVLDRNSMSLVNLRYSPTGMFWDERTARLEDQVLEPIESKLEMGHSMQGVCEALAADSRYPPLFRAAFGDEQITRERIARALAQFVRSLVSYQSKYDAGMAQATSADAEFASFTAAENEGKALFIQHCALCHRSGRGEQDAFFTMFRSLNNGLDANAGVADGGRGDVSLLASELGFFKASSLRNVEHTAPYMHDGRFTTLEEVIEHYSSGVQRHPTVSPVVFRMQFSDEQQAALVAFLKTLSDETFLNDPKFSDPWIRSDGKIPSAGGASPSTQPQEVATAPASSRSEQAARPLTSEERQSLVARRQGLPASETIAWLRDLDADGNAALDQDELAAVVAIVAEVGLPMRLLPRNGREGQPPPPRLMQLDVDGNALLSAAELSEKHPGLLELADWNGDGAVSSDEAQKYEGFERMIGLGDNGVDPTRVDRFLRAYELPPQQADAARLAFRSVLDRLQATQRQLDRALVEQVAELLSAPQWQAFQERVLEQQNDSTQLRVQASRSAEAIMSNVLGHDGDGDGRLAGAELETLARILNEAAGGFSAAGAPYAGTLDFALRVMRFDADHSGAVTALELPERMQHFLEPGDTDGDEQLSGPEVTDLVRNLAFERFVREGVYVGGGFGNVFANVDALLARQSLPAARLEALRGMLEAHHERLVQLKQTTLVEEYQRLRGFVAGGSSNMDSASEVTAAGQEVALPGTHWFDMKSAAGLEYRIFIAEPRAQPPQADLPVIYLTDANENFPVMLAALRREPQAAGTLIVGIGYADEDRATQLQRRMFDLTPAASAAWLAGQPPEFRQARTGGNEQFASFIADELKPAIAKRFSIDSSRETLFGHSLGGLFTLHTLLARGELFDTYCVSSPSIWWNNRSIVKQAAEFMANRTRVSPAADVVITVGQQEQSGFGESAERAAMLDARAQVPNARALARRLQAAGISGLRVSFEEIPNEHHGSVVLPAATRAVRTCLSEGGPAPAGAASSD